MESKKRVLARRSIKCGGCGAEIIAARADAHCPACQKAAQQRNMREYEARNRHICPECGKQISRTSPQCRVCGQKARVEKISGPNNYAWKGGRHVDKYGYVHILVAPSQYRPEHQIVWEAANGPLPKGYIVHHINGIKDDNRLENLVAASRADHTKGDKRIEHLEAELRRLRQLKKNREGYWRE